jgi:hypothetical protein
MQIGMADARLSLDRAVSAADYAIAAELRNDVYRRRLGIDPGAWETEAERDRAGHVFILKQDAVPVAVGRALPAGSPLCELPALTPLPGDIVGDDEACEVGRIATRGLASGFPYSAALLCMGSRWLLQHTMYSRFIAYCREPLVRLYEAVGAVDTGIRFHIPARGTAVYCVVRGSLTEAAMLASSFTLAGDSRV